MIVREFFMTRTDNVDLYRTYSSTGMKIRQLPTNVIYDEAIDVSSVTYTYEETNIPIEVNEDRILDPQDALDMIFGGANGTV